MYQTAVHGGEGCLLFPISIDRPFDPVQQPQLILRSPAFDELEPFEVRHGACRGSRSLRSEGKVVQPLLALADSEGPILLAIDAVLGDEEVFGNYHIAGLLQEGRQRVQQGCTGCTSPSMTVLVR